MYSTAHTVPVSSTGSLHPLDVVFLSKAYDEVSHSPTLGVPRDSVPVLLSSACPQAQLGMPVSQKLPEAPPCRMFHAVAPD